MNKMKRLFSFLLAFAIVLGAFVPFADVVLAEEPAEKVEATEEKKEEAKEEAKKEEDKKEEEKKEETPKPVVPQFTDFLKAVPKDVVGTDAEAAVRRLVAFGVITGYPDGTFKPANNLTRAEYATMAVLGLGLADSPEATTQNPTIFPDVPATHWASGFVSIATAKGVISGYPDGTFKPSRTVTYAEAVTVVVRALGYEEQMLAGKWPHNFLAKADELGLTKAAAVPANYNTPITRGDVAKLLDKTLHTKTLEVVRYEGNVAVSYIDGPLLMTKTMGITYNKDARIVGDQYVDSNLKDKEANLLYKKGDKYETTKISLERAAANYKRFVGEKANVYLDKDDIAIYVEGKTDVNSEFDYVVDAKDLGRKGFDLELAAHDGKFELADEAVVYVMDNKDDVHTLYVRDKDVKDVLKGAVLAENAKVSGLKDRVGKVVVEDNKVVYAELTRNVEKLVAPEFLVVTEVKDDKIIGIAGNEVVDFSVDFSKDSKYDGVYVFDQDGVKKEVKDIKKGDVAYIQQQYFNRGDQLFVQLVQGANVTGEVGRTKDHAVEIDGKEYDMVDPALVADGVYGNVEKFTKESAAKLNKEEAVLYQGAGKLGVMLDNNVEDLVSGYGILVDVFDSGRRVAIAHEIDGKIQEKTYDLSGRDMLTDGYLNMLELEKVNGDYVVNDSATLEQLDLTGNIKNLQGQPVRFRLTKDDKVVENTLVFLSPDLRMADKDIKFFKEAVVADNFAGKLANDVTAIEALGIPMDAERRITPAESDDIALLDYAKDLAGTERDKAGLGVAVFPSRVGRVQAVVLYNKGLDALKDMDAQDESIFVKDVSRKGSSFELTYVSFESGEGKVTDWTELRDATVEENDLFIGRMGRRSKLTVVKDSEDLEKATAKVVEVDPRKDIIKVKEAKTNKDTELIVLDGALVYDAKGNKMLVRDLEKGQEFTFIRINGTKFVTAIVVNPKGETEEVKGVVTYINKDAGFEAFAVDGKLVTITKDMILKNKAGDIIASGSAIANTLKVGDEIDIDGNVIQIKVLAADKEAANLKAAQDAVTALETAAEKDLKVKANLEAAEAAVLVAQAAVDKLPADTTGVTTKKGLQDRIDAAKTTIKTARDAFNVVEAGKAVVALETAAEKDLKVKANLEAAEAAVLTAKAELDKVDVANPNKAALIGKYNTAKEAVETARTVYNNAMKAFENAIKAVNNTTADEVDVVFENGAFTVKVKDGNADMTTSGTGLIAGLSDLKITKVDGKNTTTEMTAIKAAIVAKLEAAAGKTNPTLADLVGKSISLELTMEDAGFTMTQTYTYNFVAY